MSDDFAKAFGQAISEIGAEIKEDRKIPKTMDYILRNLVNDINQYCSEILEEYFIEKQSRYKRTIKDWDYRILDSQEFKDKILKKAWVYTMKWERGDCNYDYCIKMPKDLDNWEDWLTKEERIKECKDCFEIYKEEIIKEYKRSIDIGIIYFKKYINGLKKENLLRKEYTIKAKKQTNIRDYSENNNIDLDLLSKLIDIIPTPNRLEEIKETNEFKEVYILIGEYYESNFSDNKTLIIGTFSSLNKAIEKLEKWEADKEKYQCQNCDFNLNPIHPEWYKGIDLTEECFKNKQCPNCNHHLSYMPEHDNFYIKKYQIDGSKGRFEKYIQVSEHSYETVYEAITNFDDDTIKERFGNSKEYNLRKPNTKIKLRTR